VKKQRQFPVFYAVYFTLILLFLVSLAVCMQIVTLYLADYESSLPEYEAERVFEKYYCGENLDALIEEANPVVNPFESKEILRQYLQSYVRGKDLSYTEISTGLDSTRKYIVKANDIKISAFTLIPSRNTSEKGFTLYEPDSFELYSRGTESVTITAPLGYTVTVNEIPLDPSYRTGNEKEHLSCAHMPEGVPGIIYAEYEVTGLYAPPSSVCVLAPDGRLCSLEQTENGAYFADFLYSDTLQAEHSEYVVAAAQALAAYMQNDGKFSAAAAYVDPDSELYVNLRTSETYFVIDHSSYAFEDVKTSEFYAYDENTFSCRVSFTHVLKRYGSKDYRDYIDMTLYLHRIGDTYRIYDRYNH